MPAPLGLPSQRRGGPTNFPDKSLSAENLLQFMDIFGNCSWLFMSRGFKRKNVEMHDWAALILQNIQDANCWPCISIWRKHVEPKALADLALQSWHIDSIWFRIAIHQKTPTTNPLVPSAQSQPDVYRITLPSFRIKLQKFLGQTHCKKVRSTIPTNTTINALHTVLFNALVATMRDMVQ